MTDLQRFTLDQLSEAVTASLSNELRRKQYRENKNPLAGHCYVASEALYHLHQAYGDKNIFLYSHQMYWENDSHWFLTAHNLTTFEQHVIDLTVSQFKDTPDYVNARRAAFLTRYPSKRAIVVLHRVMDQLEPLQSGYGHISIEKSPMNIVNRPMLNEF
jgi:hypothetical protein